MRLLKLKLLEDQHETINAQWQVCMQPTPQVLLNCLQDLTSTLVDMRRPPLHPKRQMPCACLPWLGLPPPQQEHLQALSLLPLRERRLYLASPLPLFLRTTSQDLPHPLDFLARPSSVHHLECYAPHPLLQISLLQWLPRQMSSDLPPLLQCPGLLVDQLAHQGFPSLP